MKILALNWQDLTNPMAGGAEVHLEELLGRIAKKGHEVTLFCSGYSGCKPEEYINGVRIIRRGNRYSFNLIAPAKLRRLVRREKAQESQGLCLLCFLAASGEGEARRGLPPGPFRPGFSANSSSQRSSSCETLSELAD